MVRRVARWGVMQVIWEVAGAGGNGLHDGVVGL
jgi:hypothetical protein